MEGSRSPRPSPSPASESTPVSVRPPGSNSNSHSHSSSTPRASAAKIYAQRRPYLDSPPLGAPSPSSSLPPIPPRSSSLASSSTSTHPIANFDTSRHPLPSTPSLGSVARSSFDAGSLPKRAPTDRSFNRSQSRPRSPPPLSSSSSTTAGPSLSTKTGPAKGQAQWPPRDDLPGHRRNVSLGWDRDRDNRDPRADRDRDRDRDWPWERQHQQQQHHDREWMRQPHERERDPRDSDMSMGRGDRRGPPGSGRGGPPNRDSRDSYSSLPPLPTSGRASFDSSPWPRSAFRDAPGSDANGARPIPRRGRDGRGSEYEEEAGWGRSLSPDWNHRRPPNGYDTANSRRSGDPGKGYPHGSSMRFDDRDRPGGPGPADHDDRYSTTRRQPSPAHSEFCTANRFDPPRPYSGPNRSAPTRRGRSMSPGEIQWTRSRSRSPMRLGDRFAGFQRDGRIPHDDRKPFKGKHPNPVPTYSNGDRRSNKPSPARGYTPTPASPIPVDVELPYTKATSPTADHIGAQETSAQPRDESASKSQDNEAENQLELGEVLTDPDEPGTPPRLPAFDFPSPRKLKEGLADVGDEDHEMIDTPADPAVKDEAEEPVLETEKVQPISEMEVDPVASTGQREAVSEDAAAVPPSSPQPAAIFALPTPSTSDAASQVAEMEEVEEGEEVQSTVVVAMEIPDSVVSEAVLVESAEAGESMPVDKATLEAELLLKIANRTPTPPAPPPPHSPPSPPTSPPRSFASILNDVIAANEQDSGEVNALMLDNRKRSAPEIAKQASSIVRDVTNLDLSKAAWRMHEQVQPFLIEAFAKRDHRRHDKMLKLRAEYELFNEDWTAHCDRLDKLHNRIHRRTGPIKPPHDEVGLPFYSTEPATPGAPAAAGATAACGPVTISGRPNRRGGGGASAFVGFGDTVRSEAEFLEVLANLENATRRDASARAERQAVEVPDQLIDPSERNDLLSLAFHDEQRRVEDSIALYEIQKPLDVWTRDEVNTFNRLYEEHPKQFGKIAAGIPEKTTAQCVLFYYRVKHAPEFRAILSDRKYKDGRRRPKGKKRVDEIKGGKKSLLANLQTRKPDDDDDVDEGSPPPVGSGLLSPETARRQLPFESPLVFVPPTPMRPPRASSPPPLAALWLGDEAFTTVDSREPSKPDSSAGYGKKGARIPKIRDAMLLPSDGALEAAEALAGLVGGPGTGDNKDDSAGRAYDGDRSLLKTSVGGRRKGTSSSYWSVAERNELMRLLVVYGKNWAKLAEGLEHKTAVQCRNWYQNNTKKFDLAELVNLSSKRDAGDDRSRSGSGGTTPRHASSHEYTAPTGVPLNEALESGLVQHQRSRVGFFDEAATPALSDVELPPLPISEPAPRSKGIRNLLNDDTPDEDAHSPGRDDWFGGGGARASEEIGATTEEESDVSSIRGPRAILHDPAPAPSQHTDLLSQSHSFPRHLPSHSHALDRREYSASPPLYRPSAYSVPSMHVRERAGNFESHNSWNQSPSPYPSFGSNTPSVLGHRPHSPAGSSYNQSTSSRDYYASKAPPPPSHLRYDPHMMPQGRQEPPPPPPPPPPPSRHHEWS
ncbi:BQ5605_C001g00682 [Microbotryum silenes-dioicae]|uniref:BQ5605_C001g00682 protein n=1 Tax=Microbotryum silenes-dioicae TaxID=796604 RepID=A0A2X0MRH7_9BASI|nr:BQ5605_C001g00682 [Microbotryum silenes-dioicae]